MRGPQMVAPTRLTESLPAWWAMPCSDWGCHLI
nr:MAG TPA: hypothetical protein [Caudoviricetes sp.]